MSAPCGKAPSCELCPLPDCTWNGNERKKPKKTVMSPEAKEKQRAYVKKWREQNHDHVLRYGKEYREIHREQISAAKAAWYKANREKVRVKQREYQKRKAAELSAYFSEYQRKRADQAKAYTRLLEYLEAWKAQEVGLSKSVLEEVLEASRRIENEVAAEREAKS